MGIFSINLFGRTTNVISQGPTSVQSGNNQGGTANATNGTGGASPAMYPINNANPALAGMPNGTLPSDVSSWASEFAMGGFNTAQLNGNTTTYAFANGQINVDSATGIMTSVAQGAGQAPWNVSLMALEDNLGALVGGSGNGTYTFANGSIQTDSNGTITSEWGGSNRDAVAKTMGQALGLGNFQSVSVNGMNRTYQFNRGQLITNAASGAVQNVVPNFTGQGFDGNVASVAYLRGLGAYSSASVAGGSIVFHFRYGDITQNQNSDGSWTVVNTTEHG
jgi:hypothetical protein